MMECKILLSHVCQRRTEVGIEEDKNSQDDLNLFSSVKAIPRKDMALVSRYIKNANLRTENNAV